MRIIWLWLNGECAKDISRNVGTSVTTVYRWIRRWKLEGHVDRRNSIAEAEAGHPCGKTSESKTSLPSVAKGELQLNPFNCSAVWLRPIYPHEPPFCFVNRECPSTYRDETYRWRFGLPLERAPEREAIQRIEFGGSFITDRYGGRRESVQPSPTREFIRSISTQKEADLGFGVCRLGCQ